MGFAPKVAKPN